MFTLLLRAGTAKPPPFPRPAKRKTNVLNLQIKRCVAKLLMYISLTFHFRYILTEVAITTKPFEARTTKFEDVQVEMLKLQSKPWTTELACCNYWKLYTLYMMYYLPDRTSAKYSAHSTLQWWCLSIENGK